MALQKSKAKDKIKIQIQRRRPEARGTKIRFKIAGKMLALRQIANGASAVR
jgi:hypothetical protein